MRIRKALAWGLEQLSRMIAPYPPPVLTDEEDEDPLGIGAATESAVQAATEEDAPELLCETCNEAHVAPPCTQEDCTERATALCIACEEPTCTAHFDDLLHACRTCAGRAAKEAERRIRGREVPVVFVQVPVPIYIRVPQNSPISCN